MNIPTRNLGYRIAALLAVVPPLARGPLLRAATALRNLRRRIAAAIVIRRQGAHNRALLREMSTRELHDIGLTHSDVLIESGRPIWRM